MKQTDDRSPFMFSLAMMYDVTTDQGNLLKIGFHISIYRVHRYEFIHLHVYYYQK